MINMSIMALYTALKDDEPIENDEILLLTKEFIEASTGITVNLMKSIIKDSFKTVDFESISNEAPYKTIKELSEQYQTSQDSIRSYFNRNHISYKRSPNYKRGGVCTSVN